MSGEAEMPSTQATPVRRRRWGLIGAIGFIPFLGLIALAWLSTSAGPAIEAEYALVAGDGVMVSEGPAGIELGPEDEAPTFGVIIYPGGKVDTRSYATLAREIVGGHGALVVLAEMRLGLAVLSADRAAEIIGAHPEIESWVIVGHSLGGVAACEFAASNPGAVDALVLLAAYPAEGTDLSGEELPVVSITASRDSVLDVAAFEASRDRLPAETRFVEIEGGNHAQFGSYGEQSGDTPATISAVGQREMTIDAMKEIFEQLGE